MGLINEHKEKCIICKTNFAVWFYEGSYNPKCDNCIKKGHCSCTASYYTGEQELDEFGNMLPCVDYIFVYDGRFDSKGIIKELEDDICDEELIAIEFLANFKFLNYMPYEQQIKYFEYSEEKL